EQAVRPAAVYKILKLPVGKIGCAIKVERREASQQRQNVVIESVADIEQHQRKLREILENVDKRLPLDVFACNQSNDTMLREVVEQLTRAPGRHGPAMVQIARHQAHRSWPTGGEFFD